jgi:hypothetical protein
MNYVNESFWGEDADGKGLTFPDPSGGTFTGAGGFPTTRPETPILAGLDVYGETILNSDDATALLPEIEWLLDRVGDSKPWDEQAKPGAARRGLLRFKVMAEYCATHPGTRIVCVGGEA